MIETWKILRSCRSRDWSDALYWLLISSIGGLLPLWGLFLILPLDNKPIRFEDFSQNGEFALYAAAFVSASLYILVKEYGSYFLRGKNDNEGKNAPSRKDFPAKPLFVLITVFMLVFATIVFGFVTLAHFPNLTLSLNIEVLKVFSVIGFVVALILSYLTTVIDNYLVNFRVETEVRESRAEDLSYVTRKFDALNKE